MQYLTGRLAFGVYCEDDSCGLWNITKAEWLDDSLMQLRESDDSPFKHYGIEENKIVPYHEFCTYNVASHTRAYLDMLYEERFDELRGLFAEAINSAKARSDIFMATLSRLRKTGKYLTINKFMTEEFGSAWESYCQCVHSAMMNIEKAQMNLEQYERIHGDLPSAIKSTMVYGGMFTDNAESISAE